MRRETVRRAPFPRWTSDPRSPYPCDPVSLAVEALRVDREIGFGALVWFAVGCASLAVAAFYPWPWPLAAVCALLSWGMILRRYRLAGDQAEDARRERDLLRLAAQGEDGLALERERRREQAARNCRWQRERERLAAEPATAEQRDKRRSSAGTDAARKRRDGRLRRSCWIARLETVNGEKGLRSGWRGADTERPRFPCSGGVAYKGQLGGQP